MSTVSHACVIVASDIVSSTAYTRIHPEVSTVAGVSLRDRLASGDQHAARVELLPDLDAVLAAGVDGDEVAGRVAVTDGSSPARR